MRALFDKTLWAAIVVGVLIIFAVPFFVEVYALYNLTVFAVLAILALSLGLVWGFGGILALGQSAFFGVGAYVYATVAINMADRTRSEEHTSELQSRGHLVCRLLLEKKKQKLMQSQAIAVHSHTSKYLV